MTILPKKKQTKDKNDPDSSDHSMPMGHSHTHHSATNESRHEKVGRSRNSPTRWLPSTSRDEKLSGHDSGTSYDNHDNNANRNKRRHRSSPHRSVRKHRHDRGHTSSHTGGTGTVSSGSSSDYDSMTGYNSEDEHAPPPHLDNSDELERWFDKSLKDKKGFNIKKMREDGACLFRAVADQVYGDQEMHSDVRRYCIDYMSKNADYFKHYVTEDFNTYLNRKRMDHCHGNHVEMQALCELYNRPIEVYQYSIDPINTFHSSYKTDNEPIRISYHKNVHYNSVVDPYKATIGVGLGLPGLQPGLAEKNLMREAVSQSEDFHIEKAMLEDKIRETDWELTQETIEEQVARESYLQWLRDNEKRVKRQGPSRSASATCSSSSEYAFGGSETVASPDARTGRSPRNRSTSNSTQNSPHSTDIAEQHRSPVRPDNLPLHNSVSPKSPQAISESCAGATASSTSVDGAVGGSDFNETASIMNRLPPPMFGLAEWEEDDILAQVIAQSQQEYLDNLKKNATTTNCAGSSFSMQPHSS